jgi:hypothetical protein
LQLSIPVCVQPPGVWATAGAATIAINANAAKAQRFLI